MPRPHNHKVAFWKHFPISDQTAKSLIDETLRFYREVNSDFIKLTPAGNYQVAERGGVAEWANDIMGRRSFPSRFIKSPSEMKALLSLPVALTNIEQQIVNAAKEIVCESPHGRPVYATVFTPLTQLFMLTGPETFKQCVTEEPTLTLAALEKLADCTKLLISRYLQAGIRHFYVAMQHRSSSILPGAFATPELLRTDNDIIDFIGENNIGNSRIIIHVHGDNVYFTGLENKTDCAIHYELTSSNPTVEEFRKVLKHELVIGLPLSVWKCDKADIFRKTIEDISNQAQQSSTVFTTPCVVPQNINNSEVARWVAKFKQTILGEINS